MKKLFLLALILFYSTTLIAQEGEDVGWVARFGAALGVTPTYAFPNVDPINIQLKEMKIDPLSTSGMFVIGGGGYAYIMMVDNLRIGGMGVTGSQSTTGVVGGLNREVKYNCSFGGLTIEYTLPFIKNIAVSVGTVLGMGTTSIEIYQNSGSFNWTDTWKKVNAGTSSTNVSDKIANSFYSVTPTLNVDIPISRFIAVRVGGGYVASFGNDWKINNDKNLDGTPSDLSSNSFFIQTGIYFGLFAF
ncbi:MAG: hypothetical protein NTX65_17530 [Ignavibacteriales bacterium]|nr:hypothetical protein [Ignavibacteriales bacterium]